MKRVLVLTASFGEGHNTAARSIREALEATGEAEVQVDDLYAKAVPLVNSAVKTGYSFAINRAPWMWKLIFFWLDRPGWMESTMWSVEPLRSELERAIADFRPDVIVSTYPLYHYLFREIQRKRPGLHLPIITVITDSVGVNSAWHRCLADAFVVADRETAQLLVSRGIPEKMVHALGFPVARFFAAAQTQPIMARPPWKLLFMPSTQAQRTVRQIRALMKVPEIELTIVTGRHRRLFEAVKESGLADGQKCRLVGWTDAMPRLLCEHHAFIGKAGGAIVQEALAARCPFFVSHVVPGQEEGNIALIERLDVGAQALGKPERLAGIVGAAFEGDAATWRKWKENLERAVCPGASDRIARFVLDFPKP